MKTNLIGMLMIATVGLLVASPLASAYAAKAPTCDPGVFPLVQCVSDSGYGTACLVLYGKPCPEIEAVQASSFEALA